jgi:hypothetical protein
MQMTDGLKNEWRRGEDSQKKILTPYGGRE